MILLRDSLPRNKRCPIFRMRACYHRARIRLSSTVATTFAVNDRQPFTRYSGSVDFYVNALLKGRHTPLISSAPT